MPIGSNVFWTTRSRQRRKGIRRSRCRKSSAQSHFWRGPAYADVMYEDFARSEAERLEEMRLAALELRLEALTLGSFHFSPATADRNR